MPVNILMPALSPTMTEGTLAKWLVSEGDEVGAGDVIAEIETDKATMEVEAVDEGKLGKILIDAGTEGVKVNEVIAVLLEEGEDASAIKAGNGKPPSDPPAAAVEPAHETKAPAKPANDSAKGKQPANDSRKGDGGRLRASPLARRMAAKAGIDLALLSGTGPHGRIVKADIEAAQAAGKASQQTAGDATKSAQSGAPAGQLAKSSIDARGQADALGMTYRPEKNSNIRKTIARRLGEAKQTVPHFYLTIDAQIDGLLAARKKMNDRADGAFKLSVNDFIIKACALALARVPEANAQWTDDEILYFEDVDVSVAVATPNGLITPVIKQADRKGLGELSNEMKDLAARAREGKLKPEEYQGGTFSISNLGMYGIREFSAIINPPQACILAVGAGEKRPVVREDGSLGVATVMTATLSVDHRVVDGAVGAEFLAALKPMLEDPMMMLG